MGRIKAESVGFCTYVLDDPKLPKKAKDIIMDDRNEIFYSTASIWEITIKHMLHPDNAPRHNDPFDRIMVAFSYVSLNRYMSGKRRIV